MARKNRRKERLVAWIIAVIGLLFIGTVLLFTFLALKKPVSDAISQLVSDNEIEEEPEAEEEIAETEVSDNGISEESIDAIFGDVGENEEETEIDDGEDELTLQAREIVDQMTLEQQVDQLFFVTPEALTGVDIATAAGETTHNALKEHTVGGIILMGQNIVDPEQLTTMTKNLQSYSEEEISLPLFIAVDEEGGRVLRIASNSSFDLKETPPMAEIGETDDSANAYEAGNYIGTYLKDYGVNVDFAPDADVITESENKVIGDRSFGKNPDMVAEYAVQYINGLHDAGVVGCPKHYPGHGGTKEDTHSSFAYNNDTWSELEESELVPFIALINNGCDMMMVSHVSLPEVTGDDIPASMSGILITNKLRLELLYTGIVITDSINMGAIANKYDVDEASVEALKAGVDMILLSKGFDKAYEGVMTAISEGTLSEERIAESATRVVRRKLKFSKENESVGE